MKVVGLTGGIGSGKSTIANFFKDLGVPVYIADIEAKKLMLQADIRNKIIDLLGKSAYNIDEPNRKYIADIVFKDENMLAKLNAIIHPAVANHFKNWAQNQKSDYVIKEAAILFENGGDKDCDLTILVTAPERERIMRVTARDNVKESDVQARIDMQWSDEKKIPLADFVIYNLDLHETQKNVEKIHRKILRTLVNS
tara:strand:- start:198 stop:788 length:591 start_codon:yes stop_codon:yes gene_type:complete